MTDTNDRSAALTRDLRTCSKCGRVADDTEPMFYHFGDQYRSKCERCRYDKERTDMSDRYQAIELPKDEVDRWAGLEWSRVVAAALADEIPGAVLFHDLPRRVAQPDHAILADRGVASLRSQGW